MHKLCLCTATGMEHACIHLQQRGLAELSLRRPIQVNYQYRSWYDQTILNWSAWALSLEWAVSDLYNVIFNVMPPNRKFLTFQGGSNLKTRPYFWHLNLKNKDVSFSVWMWSCNWEFGDPIFSLHWCHCSIFHESVMLHCFCFIPGENDDRRHPPPRPLQV